MCDLGLKFAVLNCRGLHRKTESIRELMKDSLEVLVLTETLHRDSNDECMTQALPDINYACIESARLSARCGSVIVMFDKRKVKCRQLAVGTSQFQCVGATLQTSDNVIYTIVALYRPPGHPTICFYTELRKLLRKFIDKSVLVATGDFNIRIDSTGVDPYGTGGTRPPKILGPGGHNHECPPPQYLRSTNVINRHFL